MELCWPHQSSLSCVNQIYLEFLWKLLMLVVSSHHLLPPVTSICYWAVWLVNHTILYTSALMELLSWSIMLAVCRQTHLECLSKLFMLVGSIQSSYLASDYWHLLLASWTDQSYCIPLHFKSVQVLAFLLCPIAILCLCFSMKLGWVLQLLRLLCLCFCWILARFSLE